MFLSPDSGTLSDTLYLQTSKDEDKIINSLLLKIRMRSHKTFDSVAYSINLRRKSGSLKGSNVIKLNSNGFTWESSKIIILDFQESIWSLVFPVIFFRELLRITEIF